MRKREWLLTPFGLALLVFLVAIAFLLVAEHRAHIVLGSWLIWLLPLGCLAIHFFHGGHGAHGAQDVDHDHGAGARKAQSGDRK